MKALRRPVSEKKNFEVCLLCSHVQNCDTLGGASFDPSGNLGRGSLEDALYEKSKLYSLFLCFKLVTPGSGPVLTPGASYEQPW